MHDAIISIRLLWVCMATAALAGGCHKATPASQLVRTEPNVHVVKPERRTIVRTVGQPAFINAYEQTSVYPKVAGYVKKWNVDIGDDIKKDHLLAELFVPELVADHEQKIAQVAQDEVLIKVAEQIVEVAQGNLTVAVSQVDEAKANVAKYQAEVDRWESEVKRLTSLVAEKVVDNQVLEESKKQLKSNIASRAAATAAIQSAQATQLARKADLDKSRVDVDAARAKARVTQAEERRAAALLGYTKIIAPYNGVVVARTANTGDFVQPASGDESARRGTQDVSSARAAPLYVVARTDIVRVYLDLPETDANFVSKGTKARVRVPAFDHAEIPAEVTRTSWSLNVQSRTLRAEIDLPNPGRKLLPGMYAYGMVEIKRDGVRALPVAAVVELGNHHVCYLLENGKAAKTPIQTGASDGSWTEVSKKQVNGAWADFTGEEEVIVGDLTELSDGQAVRIVAKSPER